MPCLKLRSVIKIDVSWEISIREILRKHRTSRAMSKILQIFGIILLCQVLVQCEKEYYCEWWKLLCKFRVNWILFLQHPTRRCIRIWGTSNQEAICFRSSVPTAIRNSWGWQTALKARDQFTLISKRIRTPTLSGVLGILLAKNIRDNRNVRWKSFNELSEKDFLRFNWFNW